MTTAAPTWSSVLTSWTVTPIPDLLIVAATIGYLLLVRRLRRSATTWPPERTASWLLAMAVLALALNSSMAVYAHTLFWVHMLLHLALIMVAPVLLVWAQPIRLLRGAQHPDSRALRDEAPATRPFTILTAPALTVPLYTAVIVLTHLTGFQQAMATHLWIHDTELALYLISGYLLFLPLIGSEAGPRWLVYPLRFVVLALCMGPDTLVGVTLMLGSRVLAPAYAASHPGWGPGALSDQRAAGAIMWVGGDGLMMILMLITVLQWVRAGQGDRGLGPWLEGIRRQATVGETRSNTTEIDVDDDAAAHDAYNARLAALNGLDRRHPDNSPTAAGHGS